jgi:Fe-S cluster biogenesis protein NfuA
MQRTVVATLAMSALLLMPSLDRAHADAGSTTLPGLALLDFNYVDTSGETRDQTAEHQKRLDAFMLALRQDVAASQKYRMVAATCRPTACEVGRSALTELQDAARQAGAKILLMGGVHKMSTLIQNARVLAVNLETNEVVLDKLVTFRGDTDEAWKRAETFIAQQITASPAGADSRPAPIKLAVFDFELEDTSAGASLTNAADAVQLGLVTTEVRKLIEQSGRYRLVDISSADAEAVKAHSLGKCDGCDAAVASKLDAEQSLIGIVTRISRMEYQVTYRIRDVRTGAVIATEQTGLRMGADYSWTRGAAALIKARLLKEQE